MKALQSQRSQSTYYFLMDLRANCKMEKQGRAGGSKQIRDFSARMLFSLTRAMLLIWPFIVCSILQWTGHSEAIEEDAVPGYAIFPVYDKETNNWDQVGAAAINPVARSTGPKELRRLSGTMMTAPFNVTVLHGATVCLNFF